MIPDDVYDFLREGAMRLDKARAALKPLTTIGAAPMDHAPITKGATLVYIERDRLRALEACARIVLGVE